MLVAGSQTESESVYLTDTIRLQQQCQPALLLQATFSKLWNHCLLLPLLHGQEAKVFEFTSKAERQRERNELRPIQMLGRAQKVANCESFSPIWPICSSDHPTSQKGSQFSVSAAMAFLFINPKAKLRKPPWVGAARYPAGVITSRWCESCSIKLVNKCAGRQWFAEGEESCLCFDKAGGQW